MSKYNFWQSVLKMVVKFGVAVLPVAITLLPLEWQNLTIGGALYLVLDFLQKRYTSV